ncbi:MAG: bifunctional hydroxymethylpyrimidine kinase/phosphomethylpyrimidine kinase [Methylovirgula sp.]
MTPNVLSIAGVDPSGGAGILADCKTFAALRCYGGAVVTALTAQNTQGVAGIHLVPPAFVAAQLDALFADLEIAAVKIGMLGSPDIVAAVAQKLTQYPKTPVVLDPVLAASSGDPLAIGDLAAAMLEDLTPLVTLITPNVAEAARFADAPEPATLAGIRKSAEQLYLRGFKSVLVTGGHIESATADDAFFDGVAHRTFSAPRITTRNTHGTGCTLSAAIAAHLAHGLDLGAAIEAAKAYVSGSLAAAGELDVGRGPGPLHHFHRFW